MCGRYRLSRRKQAIDEYFSTDPTGADWTPRYNISPTQSVPIVRQNPKQPTRTLSLVRWGLIPSWTKGATIGSGVINARAETAANKPSFSEALRQRRCLIPADGFYEWQRTATGKQPYCFEVSDNEVFAFAGLWEQWRSPGANPVQTCAILTTTANQIMSDVHDRMPVILSPDSYDLWLDPGFGNVADLTDLLKPYSGTMRRYLVSARVNSVANDDPLCAESVTLKQAAQGGLFE
jgi:putative SOS response-associated peptidase YedK